MKTSSEMTRRDFLRRAALSTVTISAGPLIIPSSTLGQNAPSKRITLGIIGCGNQSTVDIPEWLKNEDCQIVAVCDVNRGSGGYKDQKQFLGREPQRAFVNRYYAQKNARSSYRGCEMYTDFREIIGRGDIDAVAIITPDHWHAIMTVLAARAGKDIYCQKPLTLTVAEGRQMIDAVRKQKRILQTGSQWRSNPMIRRLCELVRNGTIGTVKSVETYVAENNFSGPGPGWKEAPVPEGFDYDLWLGPAPAKPYHPDRCLYRFRFISDYSGGQTTNFGCHSNDIVQWALGTDATGPVEFENLGAKYPQKGALFDTATQVAFRATYASGTVLECKTHPTGFGVKFHGTEGSLSVGYNKLESEPAGVKSIPADQLKTKLYVSDNHYRNFLDCVKSRKEPIEPVEAGHRTASLCHLGNIAMKLDRKLKWDPDREEIVGDEEAVKLLARPWRTPWNKAIS